MKISTTTTLKLLGLIGLMFVVNMTIASDVELRFATAQYNQNTQELFVDIQVHYTESGQLILGGQNYRFFYDSEVLRLDTDAAKSNLPLNTYGSVIFEDHIDGVSADQVNQLIFDDNLGFVNFSIDLTDNLNGGLSLTEEDAWVTVVTLKFDVLKNDQRYDIVWGREDVSDQYATAFVEMAKWVNPSKLDKINISYYGDLNSEVSNQEIPQDIAIMIGPNPAIDYINISFENEVRSTTTIIMRNTVGKQVRRAVLNSGSISTKIDVADLVGSNYFVEIFDAENDIILTKQVIIAK